MKSEGYTLIEIMVAIGIFTVVIAAPTGFFVSSLKGQQRALASQELIDNVSYSLEYVSRTLRMAKKDKDGVCITAKLNYEIATSRIINGETYLGLGIKFKNYQDDCQEIFWDTDDNRLKESKNGGEAIPLTSDNLEVVSFKIGPPDSWDQNDYLQPKVTLFLEIQAKGPEAFGSQPKIQIQTTISQRNLDVQY